MGSFNLSRIVITRVAPVLYNKWIIYKKSSWIISEKVNLVVWQLNVSRFHKYVVFDMGDLHLVFVQKNFKEMKLTLFQNDLPVPTAIVRNDYWTPVVPKSLIGSSSGLTEEWLVLGESFTLKMIVNFSNVIGKNWYINMIWNKYYYFLEFNTLLTHLRRVFRYPTHVTLEYGGAALFLWAQGYYWNQTETENIYWHSASILFTLSNTNPQKEILEMKLHGKT